MRRDHRETNHERPTEAGHGAPRRHSLGARLAGRLLAWLLRVLMRTWRVDARGLDRLDALAATGNGMIVVFWHGKYIALFPLLTGQSGCVFSSQSFRGDVIAEIAGRFGYATVQIADHGGARSFERMLEGLAEYGTAAIAVDGPLGPLHAVHSGAIRLAARLRRVIVPVSVAAARKRVLGKRWDRMELPLPTSRVAATVGEPIPIPEALTDERLAESRRVVASALSALDTETEGRLRSLS